MQLEDRPSRDEIGLARFEQSGHVQFPVVLSDKLDGFAVDSYFW